MRHLLAVLTVIPLLIGCPTDNTNLDIDEDNDGWASRSDCNDDNADIHPEAVELCDGLDNDCNGVIDLDVELKPSWFADSDADGHGDANVTVEVCDAPEGFVELPGDCDDSDPLSFPGHDELCDGADNDCNGEPDYDATDEVDEDEDGFLDCEDCNDDETFAFPGAPEVCNGIDDDCDGDIDEDSALDATTWYVDADGDGWGADTEVVSCDQPTDFVDRTGDCDDTDIYVYPGAIELCDGLDNDCDGEIDPDGASGLVSWYFDFDGDGHGNPDVSEESCSAPGDDYVLLGDDCDDSTDQALPGGTEVCDNLDNDCNGTADDNVAGAPTWYLDVDGDTFGSTAFSLVACANPGGFADNLDDCDDTNGNVFPGAPEICNGVDDNCDSITPADESDGDTDGFQMCAGDCDDAESTVYPSAPELCDGLDNDCDTVIPANEADSDGDSITVCAGDCNDGDPSIYPGAPELCDGEDEDCDGAIDNGATSLDWYFDLDGDSYGNPAVHVEDCAAPGPSGWVNNDDDCDDTSTNVYLGATELCDGLDNDCDGALLAIEDDVDADTYMLCEGDCNDADDTIHPGATDFCDGIDQNCNGTYDEDASGPIVTWYLDFDDDSYGTPTTTLDACAAPDGYVGNDEDCNDFIDSISPSEAEACTDTIDNNCDTFVDCDDLTGCKDVEPTCWVCGDGYLDADEECDDNNVSPGDGCDEFCDSEMDLSGVYDTYPSAGREVYVWQSNSNAALTSYATFCEDRGLDWFVPANQSDAQLMIDTAFGYDSWHTWIITYNNTSSGTWGGYSVSTNSTGGQYSSTGFSAIRRWSSSYCDPETYNQTRCWDSSHSYDWLVCMDP